MDYYFIVVISLLLAASIKINKGQLLCLLVFSEFVIAHASFDVINRYELFSYIETYYLFYSIYAVKDLFFIFLLSLVISRASWLAIMAFVPSMLYHFVCLLEIHHYYNEPELLNILKLWYNFGLTDDVDLYLFNYRSQIMIYICSLQVAAVALSITSGGNYGRRFYHWVSHAYNTRRFRIRDFTSRFNKSGD